MSAGSSGRRRIAVVTADVLSARMAGPAIRATHIAHALAHEHDVMLVSTAVDAGSPDDAGLNRAADDAPPAPFRTVRAHPRELRELLADTDIVLLQGFVSYRLPWLMASDKILIFDLYDPVHLEQLAQTETLSPPRRRLAIDLTTRVLNEQLVRGDFFLCASEQQRHLWLGQLAALGRLNPANYERDANLDSLIAVAPFGIDDDPPVRSKRPDAGIRNRSTGVAAGAINDSDKVLLWAGGVYNWFDPLTLVRAMAVVVEDHPDAKLFFLGMKHPNPDVAEMQMAWDTRQVADELGLTSTSVFFNEGWVPYAERADYLLDADAGVSTHLRHLETEFSFRTRIVDYIWAGLPIVSTGGDTFGELVHSAGLGERVQAGDVEGLAAAITTVLYDDDAAAAARAAVRAQQPRFTWGVVLAPLLDFCRDATRAPDAGRSQNRLVRRPVMPSRTPMRFGLRAFWLLRTGGPRMALATLRVALRRGLRR